MTDHDPRSQAAPSGAAAGDRLRLFERLVVPHLDAGHNLGCWLLSRHADTDDVLQEAALRAFRFIHQCRGDSRAWFLTIVRNTAYSWLRDSRIHSAPMPVGGTAELAGLSPQQDTPETECARREAEQQLDVVLGSLPLVFREVLILREQEGMSYRQIASVTNAPIGTVMSRIARARAAVAAQLHASAVT